MSVLLSCLTEGGTGGQDVVLTAPSAEMGRSSYHAGSCICQPEHPQHEGPCHSEDLGV